MLLINLNINKSACFTGHRPDEFKDCDIEAIKSELRKQILVLYKMGIDTFITGMAIGVDLWAAVEVLKLRKEYPNIKLVAAIPCKNQWKPWRNHPHWIDLWRKVKDKADLAHMVSEDEYTNWCMQVRNEWMVDHSVFVISVYNGAPKGGTANCVKYANKKKKVIININPSDYPIAADI